MQPATVRLGPGFRHVARIGRFALLAALVMFSLDGARAPAFAADGLSVAIIDDDYAPRSVTVPAGTSVMWTNDGRNTHNVVSLTGDFSSGRMRTGDTFSLTFDTPGTFYYQCTVHWSMAGTVFVESHAPDSAAASQAAPAPAEEPVAPPVMGEMVQVRHAP